MTLFSIVMPSFNQEKYLPQAIDSVLSQVDHTDPARTYDVELIVIDGGSNDQSCEILNSYGDRIRWISEPDEGQSDAINKGLKMAQGEIIGWLNSDDLYQPGCLQAVYKAFLAEPATNWIYGKVNIINAEGEEIRRWITAYKNRQMRRFSRGKLLAENWISQMGVFWRKGFGEQIGPIRQDLHYAMDYDYWLRFSAHSPGRFIDQELASFRWYPTSKSGHHFHRQMQEDLDLAIKHADGQFPWAILQHRFNRWKIVTAYTLMHWLGGRG